MQGSTADVLRASPSLADGLTPRSEFTHRLLTAELVQESGMLLQLYARSLFRYFVSIVAVPSCHDLPPFVAGKGTRLLMRSNPAVSRQSTNQPHAVVSCGQCLMCWICDIAGHNRALQ